MAKSVQLDRVSFFRSLFFQNWYFKCWSALKCMNFLQHGVSFSNFDLDFVNYISVTGIYFSILQLCTLVNCKYYIQVEFPQFWSLKERSQLRVRLGQLRTWIDMYLFKYESTNYKNNIFAEKVVSKIEITWSLHWLKLKQEKSHF